MGPLALAARLIALGCLALAAFGIAQPRAGDDVTVLIRQHAPRAACPDVMERTFAGLQIRPAAIRTVVGTAAHMTRAYDAPGATLRIECNLVTDTITVTRVGAMRAGPTRVGAR